MAGFFDPGSSVDKYPPPPPETTTDPQAGNAELTVQDFLASLGGLDQLLGGQGGGGGGGGHASAIEQALGGKGGGGKGGGGKGSKYHNYNDLRTAVADYLSNQMGVDPGDIYKLDPALGEEAESIRARLEESRGQLYDLDPEAQAAYQQQLQAELALQERGFNLQKGDFLARMFGSGMEQGTFALNEGGRLIGDQQLVQQQARAANSMQQLQHRGMLTELGQQNLGMQMQGLNDQRAAELQRLGLIQADRTSTIGAAMGVQNAFVQGDAQRYSADKQLQGERAKASAMVQSAAIDAEARKASAYAQASAMKYGSKASLIGSMYGTAAQAKLGANELDWRYYDTNKSYDANIYSTTTNYQIERNKLPSGYSNFLSNVSDTAGTIGSVMTLGATTGWFSDVRYKEAIEEIGPEVVRNLKGYTFKWMGPEEQMGTTGGIMAQDLEKVLPTAVDTRPDGIKTVDYVAVVGALVSTVNHLTERLEALEGRQS